jgi:hypothetical protein
VQALQAMRETDDLALAHLLSADSKQAADRSVGTGSSAADQPRLKIIEVEVRLLNHLPTCLFVQCSGFLQWHGGDS